MELGLNYTGQETGMVQTIKVLREQLAQATQLMSRWVIATDVKLVPVANGFELYVRYANGINSYNCHYNMEQVLYYKDDPEALVQLIIDDIVDKIIRPQLRDDLTESITKAAINMAKLSTRL